MLMEISREVGDTDFVVVVDSASTIAAAVMKFILKIASGTCQLQGCIIAVAQQREGGMTASSRSTASASKVICGLSCPSQRLSAAPAAPPNT